MRNIATCYSEHAVKVSDSYCSGPYNKNSYISPKLPSSCKKIVTHTYKTKLPPNKNNPNVFTHGKKTQTPFLFITVSWCSKLICQGFFIKISQNGPHHQVVRPAGHKRIHVGQMNVDLTWDLTHARFESGPEPLGSYYILVFIPDHDIICLIGDKEEDKGSEVLYYKPKLVSQYEQFMMGKMSEISCMGCFPRSDHEVGIRVGSEDGSRSQVLWVFVDKKRVITVKKLHWNFRGNQVIFLDGLLVDVLWDVSGWFFNNNNDNNNNNNIDFNIDNNNINFEDYCKISKGCGVFMFRTRSGLDSRLWLEEEEIKKLNDNYDDKPEFSLLIYASININNNTS